MRRPALVVASVLVVIAFLLVISPFRPALTTAEAQSSAVARQVGVEGFGVPISSLVFSAFVEIPRSASLDEGSGPMQGQIHAREGTLASFTQDGKSWYAVSPQREPDGKTKWMLLQVDAEEGSLKQIIPENPEELAGQPMGHRSTLTTPVGPLDLQLYDIDQRKFRYKAPTMMASSANELAEWQAQFGLSSGSSCCITCGEITLCSTAFAELPCGSCKIQQDFDPSPIKVEEIPGS
jgi:hypothetical protein